MTPGRYLPELEQAVMARNGKRTGDEGAFSCPEPQSHRNGDRNPPARSKRPRAHRATEFGLEEEAIR